MSQSNVPVILFGYDSSPFTWKVRHALRLKQVSYYYVVVPSMMPRPLLRDTFGLTYRKIPVLLIGIDMYVDTSIICEAIEHCFPESDGYRSLYPLAADGRNYRPLIRGFASYWTDRPLFRVTTGLIPPAVWRTSFGRDRSNLIGHKLDADKLEKKVPVNKSNLDLQLSILEPLFRGSSDWIFSGIQPSLADIALFYQLEWGKAISAGQGIYNLTEGGTGNTDRDAIGDIFNAERYPGLCRWYNRMKDYLDALPHVEHLMESSQQALLEALKGVQSEQDALLPTPAPQLTALDQQNGLSRGSTVAVAPDDTGTSSPVIGELLILTPEEVVIKPRTPGEPAQVAVKMHFPRLGFTIRPVDVAKL